MDKFNCPECKEKTDHEFIKEKGDYNEIYVITCKSCNLTHDVHRHSWLAEQSRNYISGQNKAYLTKYPRYEPHTGELVKSKEHEKEVVRRMGYHPAGNGIDERYNDAISERRPYISIDD